MDEKLLSKLADVLKKYGLVDEDIEKVKTELTEEPENNEPESQEPAEEETPAPSNESPVAEGEEESVETEETEPVESEETKEEQQVEESPAEEPQPSEEAPVVEEEQPSEELPEGSVEVNPEEPVVEEPAEPQFDVQGLLGQLEEERKAREGLLARIDALESALKESGIMSESLVQASAVGVDDPTRAKDYHDDDEMFEKVLNDVNRPQY